MKVLIVKTSSMGDVIHALPAIEDARRTRPDIGFDWVVEEPFADIVRLSPAIGTIHRVAMRRWRSKPLSPSTWNEVATLRLALREKRYDLVIDAQGLLKSAILSLAASAPIAGYDRDSIREPLASLAYHRRFAVARDMHAIERVRRLFGLALGYAIDHLPLDYGLDAPTAESGVRRAFLLHGTSRADKEWATRSWIEAGRLLAAAGFSPVVTWSNKREKDVAEAIGEGVPGATVMPKSPLGTVAGALGKSALVIGTDTGLTHLAAAFAIPTVGIFLSTRPGLTGPLGRYAATMDAADGDIEPGMAVTRALDLHATRAAVN